MLGDFRVAQAIALVSIFLCVLLLLYRHWRRSAGTMAA
jgi:hypothetical protein